MEIMVPNDIELEDVFVDIHCMGKNPQGEGILLVVRKDDYIIYSGLIDGCINKNIFEENKVKKLNFICWTHPHDDHSDGIVEAINKYAYKGTKVIAPNGISDVIENATDKCKEVYNPIKEINRRGMERNGEYFEVNQLSVFPTETYVDKNGKKIDIKIKAISPVSKRVNNIRFNKSINFNELSICLVVSVNNVKFLFTSDIFNEIINDMSLDEENFNNTVYYKIPHHGSNKSNNLLLYIDKVKKDNNKIAVTTIYKKNGEDVTPNRELINNYLDKGLKVFCTSSSYINNRTQECDYGIVSTRIKLPKDQSRNLLEWDIKFDGEADEIVKEKNELVFSTNN